MCENGMNIDQMKAAVGQSDSTLGLVESWLGQTAHTASHAGRQDLVRQIAAARSLVSGAREALAGAVKQLDAGGDASVTVELL